MAELALGGACSVALAHGHEVAGKDDLQSEHDGLIYRFGSEQAKRMFDDDPNAYAVWFHGYCPVSATDHATLRRGNPEIFTAYRGRPVLLADKKSKDAFDADPERYMQHTDA